MSYSSIVETIIDWYSSPFMLVQWMGGEHSTR